MLRAREPGWSWSRCRQVLAERRVLVNGVVCIHEARRVSPTDTLAIQNGSVAPAPQAGDLVIRFADEHLVVVEKPAGIVTTRRPEEQHWPATKRALEPTLDELVQQRLGVVRLAAGTPPTGLWRVQRLDRETSGLVVFARTQAAADGLIEQFRTHTVERVYWAVVSGVLTAQTISSHLVRDRGDGVRGSSPDGKSGQRAITHLRPLQTMGAYCVVECQLETGRTHQIRIHLAELGHAICGEQRYRQRCDDGAIVPDDSSAPRLALHATRLAFRHPITGQNLAYATDWPRDLAAFVSSLAR